MRNNSLRLRLTQREVAQLAAQGCVEEKIEFGAGDNESLFYALKKADVETVRAKLENGSITVCVPTAEAENWINSNQIGIAAAQNIGNGKTLNILIEKDFACATRRDGEDDRDAFPHPTNAEQNC